jgi:hypothetical protein
MFLDPVANLQLRPKWFRVTSPVPPAQPPRLLDQIKSEPRLRDRSLSTEGAFGNWVRRFILFHGKQHPKDLGAAEVEAFLSHLAVERKVSASTQNQTKSALLYGPGLRLLEGLRLRGKDVAKSVTPHVLCHSPRRPGRA